MAQDQDQSLQEKHQRDVDVNHILVMSMEILLGLMALLVVKLEELLNQVGSLHLVIDLPERER
jgi:hypothetical protein